MVSYESNFVEQKLSQAVVLLSFADLIFSHISQIFLHNGELFVKLFSFLK